MHASRWLNAVSARLTRSQIEDLAARSFVRRIDQVLTFYRRKELPDLVREKPLVIDSADYGLSYIQNHQLGIDSLHRINVLDTNGTDSIPLNGAGVLVAFLDTGFRTNHEAFNYLSVLDTYDFINGDPDVTDDLPTSDQINHGTAVLSVCGGYDPGYLIGPAYGADYILAKSERSDTEIVIEEDYWVRASEWADSLGADIISSSLGYFDWYTYADMDGNTATTTIAADLAASRGILVVTAAGNEGNEDWHYIIAPADGDSVVAAGAVNASGTIATFSSFGPTYDGRIKPDVVAMGVGTRAAYAGGGYAAFWGTSLATPLIAGSAALILQANPTLRGHPYEIRRRLIMAADQYLDPDYQYGYGLPDMVLAAGFGVLVYPVATIVVTAGFESDPLIIFAFGPIGGAIIFTPLDFSSNITLTAVSSDSAEIIVTGHEEQEGAREYHIEASAGDFADTLTITVVTNSPSAVFKYGPNPFSDSITFFIGRSFPEGYLIEVFTLAGEPIYRRRGSESGTIAWHGVNESDEKAAAGVYIIRFSADGIDERIKVLKL